MKLTLTSLFLLLSLCFAENFGNQIQTLAVEDNFEEKLPNEFGGTEQHGLQPVHDFVPGSVRRLADLTPVEYFLLDLGLSMEQSTSIKDLFFYAVNATDPIYFSYTFEPFFAPMAYEEYGIAFAELVETIKTAVTKVVGILTPALDAILVEVGPILENLDLDTASPEDIMSLLPLLEGDLTELLEPLALPISLAILPLSEPFLPLLPLLSLNLLPAIEQYAKDELGIEDDCDAIQFLDPTCSCTNTTLDCESVYIGFTNQTDSGPELEFLFKNQSLLIEVLPMSPIGPVCKTYLADLPCECDMSNLPCFSFDCSAYNEEIVFDSCAIVEDFLDVDETMAPAMAPNDSSGSSMVPSLVTVVGLAFAYLAL